MSDDSINPSQEQIVTLYVNGSVKYNVFGAPTELNIETEQLSITAAQAELIVEAFSQASFDSYEESETARRTQDTLRDRFSLDAIDDSFFE